MEKNERPQHLPITLRPFESADDPNEKKYLECLGIMRTIIESVAYDSDQKELIEKVTEYLLVKTAAALTNIAVPPLYKNKVEADWREVMKQDDYEPELKNLDEEAIHAIMEEIGTIYEGFKELADAISDLAAVFNNTDKRIENYERLLSMLESMVPDRNVVAFFERTPGFAGEFYRDLSAVMGRLDTVETELVDLRNERNNDEGNGDEGNGNEKTAPFLSEERREREKPEVGKKTLKQEDNGGNLETASEEERETLTKKEAKVLSRLVKKTTKGGYEIKALTFQLTGEERRNTVNNRVGAMVSIADESFVKDPINEYASASYILPKIDLNNENLIEQLATDFEVKYIQDKGEGVAEKLSEAKTKWMVKILERAADSFAGTEKNQIIEKFLKYLLEENIENLINFIAKSNSREGNLGKTVFNFIISQMHDTGVSEEFAQLLVEGALNMCGPDGIIFVSKLLIKELKKEKKSMPKILALTALLAGLVVGKAADFNPSNVAVWFKGSNDSGVTKAADRGGSNQPINADMNGQNESSKPRVSGQLALRRRAADNRGAQNLTDRQRRNIVGRAGMLGFLSEKKAEKMREAILNRALDGGVEVAPERIPEPVLEAKPEIRPEPKPEPRPELKPEPKPELKPEPRPEPVIEPAVEPSVETVRDAGSDSAPEIMPEPVLEAKPEIRPEPKPEPRPELKPEPKPELKPEPRPEPKPEAIKLSSNQSIALLQKMLYAKGINYEKFVKTNAPDIDMVMAYRLIFGENPEEQVGGTYKSTLKKNINKWMEKCGGNKEKIVACLKKAITL